MGLVTGAELSVTTSLNLNIVRNISPAICRKQQIRQFISLHCTRGQYAHAMQHVIAHTRRQQQITYSVDFSSVCLYEHLITKVQIKSVIINSPIDIFIWVALKTNEAYHKPK